MRHQIYLCVFALVLFFTVMPVQATEDQDFYLAPEFWAFDDAEWTQFLNEEEAFVAGKDGMSLRFARPDRYSKLNFFVMNEDRNDFSDDIPMDELNDIAPAAGIRFSVKLKP